MTKLTPKQTEFLDSLEQDGENGTSWAECSGTEWRTAQSLVKKGLVAVDRKVGTSLMHWQTFEARKLPQPA